MRLAGDSVAVSVHLGAIAWFITVDRGCSCRPSFIASPPIVTGLRGAGTQYACFDRQAIVLWFNRFTDLKWAGMGFACFGRQAVIQRLNSFTGLKWADMGGVCFCRQIIGR